MALKVMRDILQPINSAAILIMGVYSFFWGVWIANPIWSTFDTADVFDAMADSAPEELWGGLAILVGLVIIHGVVKRSYRSLVTGALSGFFFWIIVTTFFFLGNWQNTGGITYLMIAVYCGFIWLNLRINRSHFALKTK